MDLTTFIGLRPNWALEPCLYIVKQMAVGNNAHRVGASGTHMYKDGDTPFGLSSSSLTGLLGRMTMYLNYWLPIQGTIYAALRIRKQLVAEMGQRTGMDSRGNAYNIDRGNQTLVLSKEKQLMPMDETGAIARRFDMIHIKQKTYYEPGRPLPGWERPVARQASPLTGDRPFVAPRALHTPQQPVRQFSPLVPPPAALRAAFGSQ